MPLRRQRRIWHQRNRVGDSEILDGPRIRNQLRHMGRNVTTAAHSQEPSTSSVTTPTTSSDRNEGISSSNTPAPIPGFYFDSVKKRYFRNLRKDLPSALRPINPPRDVVTKSHGCSANEVAFPRSPFHRERRQNLTCDLLNRDTYSRSSVRWKRAISEDQMRLLADSNRYQTEPHFVPLPLSPPIFGEETCEMCQYLEAAPDGQAMLTSFSIQERNWNRIMPLTIRSKREEMARRESGLGLDIEASEEPYYALDRNVIDLCMAPMDAGVTCVLYVTMPFGLGSRIFFQPVPEFSRGAEPGALESPIYNLHWGLNVGTRSVAWSQANLKVALGTERFSMIMDIVIEASNRILTVQNSVLSQRFSQDGNFLFLGLRNAPIRLVDLRTSDDAIALTLPQDSATQLVLLSDENYLISTNFSGEVVLFDVRYQKAVNSYGGLKNSYSKLPLRVDNSENLIFSVGEDGNTLVWSLKSSELLCRVKPPKPITCVRDDVPRFVFSDCWAGITGNAGLVIGQHDSLYWYSLKL